jgi:hypothetical protein
LEIVLNVNNLESTGCVARHCGKFSSGTKYIRLTNPVPYMEEEEEEEEEEEVPEYKEKTTALSYFTDKRNHIMLYRVYLAISGIRTHNVSW